MWAAAALVVLTKFGDCWSTQQHVRSADSETNPFGKMLMRKLGFKTAIWAIFAFVVAWTLALAAAASSGSWLTQAWFVALALVVSIMQAAVAYTNTTHRWNFITRWVLGVHMRQLNRRKSMPKRELKDDEVYVVHLVEDGLVPPDHTMQICREWGTAMSVVDGFMAAECSEDWTPHIIREWERDTLKARWTWGDSEIRITVENVA